ncbi:MAG TPA: polyprenol monophosphomannose synthase [Kineosporiaceae bacterium]|nr:polyprenol monophosphomannose synthase [Kineosporiaceae bacterium]
MAETSGRTVVVVPTYNERENLPVLVEHVRNLVDAGALADVEVLVVDDNSPDGTGEVADKLARDLPGAVAVLHRTGKEGLGRAYVAGMTRALDDGAEVVVQMDADLSHPVSVLPIMLQTLRSPGADVVIGSRYVPGGSTASDWPWHRKALSAWANLYVNAILRLHVKDATAGFKAWRAPALRAIDLPSVRSDGYSFQVELLYRAVRRGLTVREVPIRFEERVAGASKMSLRVQLESAAMPWKLRFGRRA